MRKSWWRPALVLATVAALAAAGCEGWNERGSLPLAAAQTAAGSPGAAPATGEPPMMGTTGVVSPTDAGAPADPPPPGDTAPAPEAGTYAAMCRNYCGALLRTQVYGCLGAGQGDIAACQARFASTPSLCEEMRCAPMLVDQALCFKQCDALAPRYEAYCAQATASSSLCPITAADHDDACRAGCAVK
jgi:hypothetical protein